MKQIFIYFCLLFLTLTQLSAQQINVSVMIQPPYSNKIADYIEQGNNIVIRVTNMSQSVQQIKLIPSLEGNNGVSVKVRENFIPTSPIIMAPNETKMFSYNQLRPFNSNLSQNDLILQGISFSVLEGAGVLPEGTYTLCIKAIAYGSNTVLSEPSGCNSFLLSAYDPPMILMPTADAVVNLPQPQLLTFQWTPSGISGKTRYTLRMVDMTSTNLFNPNDAFNNPFIAPFFEQTNISTSIFIYDMGKPALFPGRKYAVQVVAYDPDGKLSFKNNGKSLAIAFSLAEPQNIGFPGSGGDNDGGGQAAVGGDFPVEPVDPNTPPLDPDDVADCMSAGACQTAPPGCDGAQSPTMGSTVLAGKFKLTINEIQAGNGNGTIEIPYLNTKVEVAFQNLSVNAQNQVCGLSQIWVKSASQNLIPDDFLKAVEGVYSDNNLNWQLINQHIQQNNKKVSLFNIDAPANTLPFSLDLGSAEVTILGIVFTPTAAYANIAFSADIPLGSSNQHFSLGMRAVCIRPNGFGIADADAMMTLGSDLVKNIGNDSQFILEGGNNGSYVKFDCKGVKEVKLKGGITFDRNKVLPVNAQGDIVSAPAKYSVQFNSTVASMKDWLVEGVASHPSFTSTQANGFRIGFSGLVIDFSKTKNPDAMAFPSNHPMANDPIKTNWTGIVLSNPVLTLPNYLKRSDNQKITVDVADIVLDSEGLWTMLDVNNVIQKLEDGNLGGWGFSIDKLSLDIRKSLLQGGAIDGKVNLPITETGLGYNASYQPGDNQNDMKVNFGIVLQDNIDIDMIFAQATLANNSTFGVEINNNKVVPKATLHGSIAIGWEKSSEKKPGDENNNVTSFSLPKVDFQGLSIFNNQNDIPQLNLQGMQLSNPNEQGKLSGFPIKLKGNPSFINNNPEVGFKFGLEFTLTKNNANGISGATDFTIFAKYSPQEKRFTYDRTQLSCISLDVDVAAATLKGQVCIYKNDEEFGDGFSGSIEAVIKGVGVEAAVALQIGNVNNYDYFYFEVLAKSGIGIPITTSMSLYGLGGGFYYNMNRTDRQVTTVDGYDNIIPPSDFSPGYSPSGLKYSPEKGSKGFNATVVFGLTGGEASASAFNGDLTFWMQFNGSGGISKMGFNGGGYGMQPLNSRENAAITGDFKVQIDFVNKTFDLAADLNVNVANGMMEGNAGINMHASPNEWFVYIGEWDTQANKNNYEPWNDKKRNQLNVDLVVSKFNFNMYFMMGSKMPELPPLPGKVLANMKQQDGQNIKDERIDHPSFNPNSPGFAFGAGFTRKLELTTMIFYADIEFFAGFDVLMKNYGSQAGCENIGINGWFAKGQAYAYLGIEAGLDLDIWIYKDKFKILGLYCSAVLEAEFTNPNWIRADLHLNAEILNGLITVNKNIRFEAGKKMACGGEANPFGDLPIVSEIFPANGDKAEVYDDVRIAFNFPKGNFEVFNELEPDKMPKFYYYKIQTIELKKGNSVVALADEPIYSNDGYSAKFLTKNNEFLPEKSQLKLKLIARGYEAKPGTDPMKAEETYNVTFNTNDKPDHIPNSQLLSTVPLVRQRYFLKDDFYQGHARTLPGKNFCYLFNKSELGDPGVFDQSKTQYLAQFTEMGSGKITEVPCNCLNGEIRFSTPSNQLKNDKMYRVRLIARMEYRPKINIQGNQLQMGQNNWETGKQQVSITQGAYKLSRFLLADNSPKTYDHSLLKTQWFFKTSKYNTLSAKLADYKSDGSTYTTVSSSHYIPRIKKTGETYTIKTKPDGNGIHIHSYELPVALITGKEAFDMYDLYGYTVNNMGDQINQHPLMGFIIPDFANTHHNAFYQTMRTRMIQMFDVLPNLKSNIALPAGRNYNQTWLKDFTVSDNIGSVYLVNNMNSGKSDRIWAYSSKYLTGIGNIVLPPGRSIWKPHGALTQQEIDEALAATQLQQNMNINQMQLQIVLPQPPGQSMQGNLNLQSNVVPVYPVVNMSDLLAIFDYSHLINETWKWVSPGNRGIAFTHQETISPLLFREKGNYSLKWGNLDHGAKQFNYNWTRNKPKLIF
jgi:TANFOR domain-containing protein